MTRFEFTENLRKALSGRVSHQVVNENVAYYENYIDTEIKKGRSEEAVLEELGDPRWIAKTIIDTAREDGASVETQETFDDAASHSAKIFRMPTWLLIVLFILLCIAAFKVVGLLIALLPVLLTAALVLWLVRYFRDR
jgi:uncharacterized membrane protein